MAFLVIRCVAQDDVAISIESDSIVRLGEILRRQPEVEGMVRHRIESEARRDGRSTCAERYTIELTDEGDVAHRVRPILRTKIEIVDRERFLKDDRVRASRYSHHHGVCVPHVVTADHVRSVRESVGMSFIRGQSCGNQEVGR